MGRIAAPFGVRGWLKVEPFTTAAKNLLAYPTWWIRDGTRDGAEWEAHAVAEARARGRAVIARLAGCEDRDAALELRGAEIAVPRALLPQTQPNEYYWADLIGLKVASSAGVDFGSVIRILATGANDVLVVQSAPDGPERLIPFIADVIAEVDLESGAMRVNWDADY
jgi:16S rRNA processing protein RimM